MDTDFKRLIKMGLAAGISFGAILGIVGCGPEDAVDTESETGAAAQSENGLTANGLTLNGLTANGLTANGLTANGLTANGLTLNGLTANGLTANGLSAVKATSGLMTTSDGRDLVKYMAKCALSSSQSLVAHDQNGAAYTYPGSLGVAQEWMNSACSTDCQERISACVLAHVNNAGVHIALWVTSESNIGWGLSSSYPFQEGAFFGNIFGVPKGYYCAGKDFYDGSVPGRLGATIPNTQVYVNPYSGGGRVACQGTGYCSEHSDKSGYDNCRTYDGYTWKHVVTTWRNYDVNSNYKICSYGWAGSGNATACLGVVGSSKTAAAKVEIRQFNSSSAMKWQIVQTSTGKYKIVNLNSGMVLDVDSSGNIIQNTYSSSDTGQQIVVTSRSSANEFGRNYLNPASNSGTSLNPAAMTDGSLVSLTANITMDSAKWVIIPL